MTTGSKNIILLSATLTATLSVGTLLKRAGNKKIDANTKARIIKDIHHFSDRLNKLKQDIDAANDKMASSKTPISRNVYEAICNKLTKRYNKLKEEYDDLLTQIETASTVNESYNEFLEDQMVDFLETADYDDCDDAEFAKICLESLSSDY